MNPANVLLMFVATCIVGCGPKALSPAEQAARDQAMVDEFKYKIANTWSPKCEALGYEVQSSPWRDCVMSLSNYEDQQAAEERQIQAAKRAYWGKALQNFGTTVYGPSAVRRTYIQPSAPTDFLQPPAPTQPITTVCSPGGTFTPGITCTSQ